TKTIWMSMIFYTYRCVRCLRRWRLVLAKFYFHRIRAGESRVIERKEGAPEQAERRGSIAEQIGRNGGSISVPLSVYLDIAGGFFAERRNFKLWSGGNTI